MDNTIYSDALTSLRARILMLLTSTREAMTPAQIAKLLGVDVYYVSVACRELNKQALIALTRVERTMLSCLSGTPAREDPVGFIATEPVCDNICAAVTAHMDRMGGKRDA